MGWGKSAPEEAPTVPSYGGEENLEADMEAQMMQAMAMMMSMGSPAPPAMPTAPEVIRGPEVDWSEKQKRLAKKMGAEFHMEQLQRHGIAQSVHSSPLTDDVAPEVSESILTGTVE